MATARKRRPNQLTQARADAPATRASKKVSARSRSAVPRPATRATRGSSEEEPDPAAEVFRVEEVSAKTWPDFEALFGARGSPHYCWCTVYRFRDAHLLSREQKRDGMLGLVRAGTPIGVLAYSGDTPIGWCSVGPRESYVRLARSRTMPRVSAAPTWTVLCFFVQRAQRGKAVTGALLAAAIDAARRHGAEVVEGYPHDTAGISASHRGSSKVFRALGFVRAGTRWSLDVRGPKK